jgi:hypothetical protein
MALWHPLELEIQPNTLRGWNDDECLQRQTFGEETDGTSLQQHTVPSTEHLIFTTSVSIESSDAAL